MEPDPVSPVRIACVVSIRGAADCAYWLRIWVGERRIARSSDLGWLEGKFEDGGDVISVSAAVEFDMLLDDENRDGAVYILAAVDT
jgi:hypothetical protein